jgi:glycerol-3-phosphate acyltransferase PlsY
MGVMLFLLPIETVIALITWFAFAKTLKISSVSSLLGLSALMISSFYIHPNIAHAPVLLIGFILFYKHIPNIIRVFQGQEKRVI